MNDEAILVLEDGTVFYGQSIGISGSAVGEVVFNTSMTGYQEILTDPSYAYQMITLTCPHIGNVGTNVDDEESSQVYAQGLIVRDVPLLASSYRNQETLGSYLKRHRIVAIAHVDTRKLTRVLCQQGAQRGCILAGETPDVNRALQQARAFPGLNGMDLAKVVTTRECYEWTQGSWFASPVSQGTIREKALPHHVVVYDFGVKRTILRLLVDRGCHLTVVPAETSADAVVALNPDGILLSNGPGDPAACHYAIHTIQRLLQTNIPIFGICLGHQLLALACGAKTVKMKFGHHGGNHPVKDQLHDRVMITAQNHSFAVDQATLPVYLKATHWSLFDKSLQGIHHLEKPAFSFQGHPEASPGPQDAAALFDHFVDLIIHYRQAVPTSCPNSQCANGVK